jgi:type VI secretion system secreted protein VgrG
MPTYSEYRRLFHYNGPHAGNLFVNHFSGTEQISQLFRFDLELVSEDATIQTEEMLGQNVTVGIRQRDGVSYRYFNGHLSKFSPLRHDGRMAYYEAELVPWVWFLTLTKGCWIYQDKTLPQVIREVFARYGYTDYDDKNLTDRHKPWENCCQYQESAWDFVARLMEIEGMYYYFKHEEGKHTLIIVDNMAAHLPCPFQSTMRYEHQEGTGLYRTEDTVFSSDLRKVVKPNKYAHKDYNFKIPGNRLLDEREVQRDTGVDRDMEVYEYPGAYEWPGDVEDWVQLRIQEQEHDHTVAHGTGNCRSMLPGFRFDMTEHDRGEQNLNYLLVSVTHNGQEGTFVAGADAREATYENTFTAHPSSVIYRPPFRTDETRMAGSQTARVVGPPGEEIYTDKYGRVRVKFNWDRRKSDENGTTSCWIRVMQPWGGPMYGQIWIPRVGMEVIVDFIDGDPDRPIITGCVYNNRNMPPYPLPANKEWSGVKTRSTKGGTQDNYNEIRLVDSIGQELFRMQAEKDLHIFVKNDRSEYVLHDRFLDVGADKHERIEGNKYTDVYGDFNEHVKGKMNVQVDDDATFKVGGGQTEAVQKDKNQTVGGDFGELIEGDTSIHNQGDYEQKVDGDLKITIGGKGGYHITGDVDNKVDGSWKLKSEDRFQIKSGEHLMIEAAASISLTVGSSTINLMDGQITIQANKVLINCGLGAPLGADDANPDDANPDDPDTPDDVKNPDDPRFKSPAGDLPQQDSGDSIDQQEQQEDQAEGGGLISGGGDEAGGGGSGDGQGGGIA